MLDRVALPSSEQNQLSLKRLLATDHASAENLRVRSNVITLLDLQGREVVDSELPRSARSSWPVLRGLINAERNRKRFQAELEELSVQIPLLTKNELEARAFRHHALRAGTAASRRMSPKRSTRTFIDRLCVSYLADVCDPWRAQFVRRIGKHSATERKGVFTLWVYREIGRLYPELEDECIRQLESKDFSDGDLRRDDLAAFAPDAPLG